ncbi:uncharacterized protein F5891DRAFT_1254088 [Suillus fuscotomentosus]|uniref:Uncharacterized protein n=1 Tax=Suillus fuscotomentosus TaxID=1912939 RepID=A0AAD4DVV4_9AGAM|nr:uncharacterized protein F5891DRAFT_1254088 [Suillus fuscotomentosus]KAG1895059.1 hypothetical protein F5891DRAFT_1254088 [Suillus fuscotomentosus]
MSRLSDYRRLRTGFGPAISTAIIYCKPDAYQFKLRVKEKPTLLQVQPNLTLATGIKQTGECLALIRVAPLSPLSWGCFLGTRQALVRPRVSRFLRGAAPAKKVNLEGAADPSSKALPSGSKVADPPRELTKSQAKVRGSSGLLLTTALRPQSSTKATSHHLVVLKVGAEVGDVKLASARLGEGAGLTVAARELIKQVAKGVPRAMMYGSRQDGYTYDGCKVILANADQHVGQSVKTRPTAADLGRDLSTLKNQLRIPAYSPVEVVPLSVELWPALTHPETPERAKVVLNKAHEAVPKSHEI